MSKKIIAKALSLVIVIVAILSLAPLSTPAAAASEDGILAQSIVHSDKLQIAFAVGATLDEIVDETVTLTYSVDGGEEKPAALYTDGSYGTNPVLVTEGFAAQDIGKTVTATLYRDGSPVDTPKAETLNDT